MIMSQLYPPPNTAAQPSNESKHACMSFTAPQFSMQDEEKEKDDLSPEVKEALRQDLYGYSAIIRETSEFLRDGREKMEEFLEHEIPAERKEEYTEALQQAPVIVADESDPVLFLRAEAYDPEAAAWRMVHYWRMRKSIFGAQAFAPLRELEKDQQRRDREQGADDLHVEGGYPVGTYVPLPPDDFGRSVTFFADGRQHDAHRALRRTFLLFHGLVHRLEYNQRHGCVIVVDARSIEPNGFNRKQYRRKLELIREAVPMRIRAIHICFAAFKSPSRLLQPSILWMYGTKLRVRRHVHYGDRKILAKCLLEYGLKLEALPPSLGGTLEVGGIHALNKGESTIADPVRHRGPTCGVGDPIVPGGGI